MEWEGKRWGEGERRQGERDKKRVTEYADVETEEMSGSRAFYIK